VGPVLNCPWSVLLRRDTPRKGVTGPEVDHVFIHKIKSGPTTRQKSPALDIGLQGCVARYAPTNDEPVLLRVCLLLLLLL
jgi:hypothetical protein